MRNPLYYLLAKMWVYARDNRRNIVLYAALVLGANLVIALEPMTVGLFLNAVQTNGVNHKNFGQLMLFVSAIFFLEIIFWSMHGPARVIENRNAFRVRANYKNHLLGGVFGLPIEWHTNHHSGDTIDKIEKGTESIFNFASRTFEIEQSLIMLATSIAALFIFSIPAAITAIVLSASTFYLLTFFDRKLVRGYRTVNRAENQISAKVYDALSNISTIIVLRAQSLVLDSLKREIEKPYRQYDSNIRLNELKWFFASVMGRLTVVITVGVYLFLNLDSGTILAGTIYILFNYSNKIREVFYQFAYAYHDIVSQRASVANSEELPLNPEDDPSGKNLRLSRNWQKIEIAELSFAHHNCNEGLADLSLEILRGEHIAIIGPSGAGKSTLLKIIRDLHRPKNLKLLVDGARYNDFGEINDSISLIPQEPEIFASTIRENITLGIDYKPEAIRRFADMARFLEVIARLPKGIESSIVEKGVNLSGGEKQRLALARGLLASAEKDIILLDEPTSSVDFYNELSIYENIFRSFKGKTVISSIHRLYLLPMFDRIYFLKEGRLAAEGTFDNLRNNSDEFKELWSKYNRRNDPHR